MSFMNGSKYSGLKTIQYTLLMAASDRRQLARILRLGNRSNRPITIEIRLFQVPKTMRLQALLNCLNSFSF